MPDKTLFNVEAMAVLDLAAGLSPRGVVRRVGDGIAWASGLEHARFEELVAFDSGAFGLAYDLLPNITAVILLSGSEKVHAGDGVAALGRLPSLPVGPALLGRVIDPLGDPLDDGPPPLAEKRLPLFRPAPEILERKSVDEALWTGVPAIDGAIPIGRGQRELIIGDRNVGKTSLAIDLIHAQKAGDVICVYVAIGQPMSRVLAVRETLERAGALSNTVIVSADASSTPGMRYLAPYAGTSVAESFQEKRGHAMIIYDDLTKHADSYRELTLLMDRPPGREAYPGDIFSIHAELLERAHARRSQSGGGSVTAFPVVETTDGDISSYIPTNLISITDGQIYLDTARFDRDLRPAIDVGRSVSRIGSAAQPPIMRQVARNLRSTISRFESLEALTRVGLDIDLATKQTIDRGQVLRQLLRRPRLAPRGIAEQVVVLTAVGESWLDDVKPADARRVVDTLLALVRQTHPELIARLDTGQIPEGEWRDRIAVLATQAKQSAPSGPSGARAS